MKRIASLVGLVGLALVAGCATESIEQEQDRLDGVTGSTEEGLTKGGIDPTDPIDPQLPTKPTKPIVPPTLPDSPEPVIRPTAPIYRAMAAGDGWRTVNVAGQLMDVDTDAAVTANEDVYVVDSIDKIDNAPLAASTKTSIKASFSGLTGDARQGAIFVRKQIETDLATQAKQGTTATPLLGCSDVDKSFTKNFSTVKSFNYTNSGESGHFVGSFGVNGQADASVTGTITLTLKQVWAFGCHTYWGHLKSASFTGNANVNANGKANGTFSGAWSKSVLVTEPKIYDDWVSVGGIPLWIKVTLPIEAGIDASAQVNASVDGHLGAHASFSMNCQGTDDCTSTKSASIDFHPNTDAHLGVNVRAKVTPFAKASVKLSLYDGAATGKIGIKAGLISDFWGYYGNTCGDANADGVPEYVQAATLDEALNLDLVADVGFFGSSAWNHTWNIGNWHLGFWDLLGHSTALDPIVYSSYAQNSVNAKMRPCYPYAEGINYQVNWMDNTALESFSSTGSKTAATKGPHGYTSPFLQRHSVTVNAVSDTKGRTLNGSTLGFVDPRPTRVELER